MNVVYFAKEVPATPVWLGNGTKIQFDTVDGITGYTLSGDSGVISQLNQVIRKGIGGVRYASEEEYLEFLELKKNSENRKRQWREEINPNGGYAPDIARSRGAAAAENQPGRVRPSRISLKDAKEAQGVRRETKPLDEPVEEFKPRTSKK